MLVHRQMAASPEPCLKTSAPYREPMVVCVACLCTWDWLADLCARAGLPCVLGHALSMEASHGGKAKNDRLDAPKSAVLLRGGLLPQAYGSPAAMRATRALLRRRLPLMRTRAERLAHVHNTTSEYHLPESGKKIAYQAKRDGVATRFPAPTVHKSIAVALAWIASYAQLRPALAVAIVQTARQHAAHPLSRLPTVPGIGQI